MSNPSLSEPGPGFSKPIPALSEPGLGLPNANRQTDGQTDEGTYIPIYKNLVHLVEKLWLKYGFRMFFVTINNVQTADFK